MRQAARAAEAAMRAAIDTTAVGVTENEIAAEVHKAQILAGSEYTGLPLFISSGPRTKLTHATWYRRQLEQNDSMLFELVGAVHRYHAALFRPVFLGDPPDSIVKGAKVSADTLQKAKDIIKPGTTCGDVHKLIQDNLVEGLGLDMIVSRNDSRVGYSIGIAYAPDWGEGQIISFYKNDPRPLQAGMTFHLIVMVRIPGLGPVPSSDTI